MIDPVTGWFKITQYNEKIAISTTNLFETTWLIRYPIPTEITHYQGSEFIGQKFIKYLIETEYGITSKPINSGNPTSNTTLKLIHQVRKFIIKGTYVEKYDLRPGIVFSNSI